jgi:ATP-dependent exoDNAse (exonuclease V) alpha subunit
MITAFSLIAFFAIILNLALILNLRRKFYNLGENIKKTREEFKDQCEQNCLRHEKALQAQKEEFVLKLSEQEEMLRALQKKNEAAFLKLQEQEEKIALLQDQNKKLRRDLEFFTQINEDSQGLNALGSVREQEDLTEQALRALGVETAGNSCLEKSTESPSAEEEEFREERRKSSAFNGLDAEQSRAYQLLEGTNNNFFITGKAGTGKSFLLRLFTKGTSKRVLKVAPTGIAALNIDGATIHRTFGYFNLEHLTVDELNSNNLRLAPGARAVLKNVNAIIIDEISMVRADVFQKIDKILKIVNKTEDPFGGKQIIVFGDLFQLPPIAKKSEIEYLMDKYGGIYFFNSDAYKEGQFRFIELCINHRQEGDDAYFEILNRIREGECRQQDIDIINQRVIEDPDDLRRIIRLYPKRSVADNVNRAELARIPAKEYVYNYSIKVNATGDENIILENFFQAASTLHLKVGALIVMTRNDKENRWVNGTLGIVSKLDEKYVEITINGRPYKVIPENWEIKEARYQDGNIVYSTIFSAVQYPILLAYAMTIHKSQGMTYKKIACDPSDCFATGQAYVALSRCASLDGLHLIKAFNEADIRVDATIQKFYAEAKEG